MNGAVTGADTMVELRCPESMGKLLGRAQAAALPGGQVEIACTNCARRHRAAGEPVTRVLHRFNLLGELLTTDVIVHPDGRPDCAADTGAPPSAYR